MKAPLDRGAESSASEGDNDDDESSEGESSTDLSELSTHIMYITLSIVHDDFLLRFYSF